MQTNSFEPDAIIAKRQMEARRKLFFGLLFLFLGLGGLFNVWSEQHTFVTFRALSVVGLAILGAGFLMDAQYIAPTNKAPKSVVTLAGQCLLGVGIVGTTVGELGSKWTNSHDAVWLLALFFPLLLAAVGLIIAGVWFAAKAAPARFGSLFSRER